MKRFTFSLEQLLRLRCSQLDAENARLEALYGERKALEAATLDVKECDAKAAGDLVEAGAADGIELVSLARYHDHNRRRLIKLSERHQDCEQRIEKQRGQVLALDRAKQLLERMKEKQFQEWQYETNREIEATAAELYLSRWSRRA